MFILFININLGCMFKLLFQATDLIQLKFFQLSLTAFISYEKYCGNKEQLKIKYPPIDFLDINTLISWNDIRKLGISIKKNESIPIDILSVLLFAYVVLLILLWFFDSALGVLDISTIFDYGWSY